MMAQTMLNESIRSPAALRLASWLFAATMLVMATVLLGPDRAIAEEVVVYKSPTCGCCKGWVEHLKEKGFPVRVHNRRDLNPIKKEMGVPRRLQSCHTAKVGDYAIEGHVPADVITRLLQEDPSVMGLAVPGMPMGSPGMEGPRKDPYHIIAFGEDRRVSIYASRNQ